MSEQQQNHVQLTLARLRQVLGDDLVCYVLSIDRTQGLDGFELDATQSEVLSALDTYASPQANSSNADGLDVYMSSMNLASIVEVTSTSVANTMRQMTGGEVEQPTITSDAVVDALMRIAKDIWPVYLVRPAGNGPRTFWMATSPHGLYRHSELSNVVDAFMADPHLKKLFPYESEETADSGISDGMSKAMRYQSLVISSGQGGSLQLITLLTNLLASSVFRCLMKNQEVNVKTIGDRLVEVVSDLRKLADKEVVETPALVGLAGLTLPEGEILELPSARIRSVSSTDRDLFMSGAPSLQSVLEVTSPSRIYSIEEHKFDDGDDPFKAWSKFHLRMEEASRSFARKVDMIRFALLLASESDQPWAAKEVARYVPSVLNHGGSSWDPGFASIPSYELPSNKFGEVEDWLKLVTEKHVTSLDIGMRRLLSASTLRSDPIDAFVDAVVCWENMFGVHTETSFRVTGSVAKLLEPDDLTKREELHSELKDLYGKRSRLVHGGPEPSAKDVDQYRRRSIEIATDCFRVLYRDRPDLLELASDKRGARVLLE